MPITAPVIMIVIIDMIVSLTPALSRKERGSIESLARRVP